MRAKYSPRRFCIIQTCLPDYRLEFMETLVRMSPETRLICGKDFFTPNLSLVTDKVAWCNYVRNWFWFKRSFLWQVGVLRKGLNADLLVAEFNPRVISTWVLLVLRRFYRKPTLLWGHLWGEWSDKSFFRGVRLAMLHLSNGMICYNYSQGESVGRLLEKLPVWVAANSCVKLAQCVPLPDVGNCGSVVYVGRLIPKKKPQLLLRAFARVVSKLPIGAKLIFAGHGSEQAVLVELVKELGLTGRVEFLGHVAGESELLEIYRRASVAVSPGYVGLSAIQCMALGIPMIVADKEPHSPEIEACQEGKTCILFASDHEEDLGEKILEFYRGKSPLIWQREEISRFIARNYTIEGMANAFADASSFFRKKEGAKYLPKVAFVWASFGPYHYARLNALNIYFGYSNVLGLEIARKNDTYAWKTDMANENRIVTITKDRTAEETLFLTTFYGALREFRRNKSEVVFVPSYWPANSLAVNLAARVNGSRVVMMNDSHAATAKATGFLAWAKAALVRHFDAAFVAGTPQKRYFSKLGLDPSKIITGYDAVDNDFFIKASDDARISEKSVRAKHGLPPSYFLNVGRMEWKKNLEVLIDAYKVGKVRFIGDYPRLVLVGSGRLKSSLIQRCKDCGLSVCEYDNLGKTAEAPVADVYFFGFRQVDELPDFYAFAKAFILPSRVEEWGLVVNEAMACKLPVIVSRNAGCAEDLVKEGENGFLFNPFDAADLADKLVLVIAQPELARSMGEASRRMIRHWGCEEFAIHAGEAVDIAMNGF